jgi:hypothetical protein
LFYLFKRTRKRSWYVNNISFSFAASTGHLYQCPDSATLQFNKIKIYQHRFIFVHRYRGDRSLTTSYKYNLRHTDRLLEISSSWTGYESNMCRVVYRYHSIMGYDVPCIPDNLFIWSHNWISIK